MKRITALITSLLLALVLAACTPAQEVELLSIAETAEAAGTFDTLLAALTEAELAATFADDTAGPFTVFAPTDTAFAQLLEDLDLTAAELLALDGLADILTYHVVSGRVLAADVVDLIEAGEGTAEVTTLNGAVLTLTLGDDGVVINGTVNVVATDILATNGVIHVIDAVLLPPQEDELLSIAATAEAAGSFGTLLAALAEAELAATFADDTAGPFTVFAPTDTAFAELLEDLNATPAELLAREDLGDILTYHVVSGQVLAAEVLALIAAGDGSAEVETLNGAVLTLTVVDGGVVINGTVNVVDTDILATNGVIHVIDAVLLPPPTIN
jgi:transforming growth factor-beta-induced protein